MVKGRSILFGVSLCSLLAAGLGAVGLVVWVQSRAGEAKLSGWLTAQVQEEFPGTRLMVSAIRWAGPAEFRVGSVTWSGPDGRPILELNQAALSLRFTRAGGLSWNLRSRVERLDLQPADQLFAQGRWKATGMLSGQAELSGGGGKVEVVGLKLEAGGGGDLNNEGLSNLLAMLPASAGSQERIVRALREKTSFHYAIAKFEVVTEGDTYRLGLLLDGDHLLDLNVRVPKDSVELLKDLFLKEGSSGGKNF